MYFPCSRWPSWLWLLSLGYLGSFTTAQICRGTYNLTRPEDVESLFQDCTRVTGDVIVTNTYRGPLILPNITTIEGTFQLEWVTSRDAENGATPPQVTSIELPDIETIKNLKITNITTLKSISMPQLTSVGWHFAVYQVGLVTDDLDFPSLRKAPNFYLAGGFPRVNLNSLGNVSDSFYINGAGDGRSEGVVGNPLAIKFPALEYVYRMMIEGRVSSINMPKLESVGRAHSGGGYSDDVIIRAGDTPASFAFPSLQNLTGTFSVDGPIKSLDVSGLQTSKQNMIIRSSYPLSLDLPMKKVVSLHLSGDIQSVNFSRLEDFNVISVSSNLPVGCKNLTRQMDDLTESLPHSTRYSCDEPHKPSPLLGLLALLIIPVGVIAAAGYLYTKGKREKNRDTPAKWETRPLSAIEEEGGERQTVQG